MRLMLLVGLMISSALTIVLLSHNGAASVHHTTKDSTNQAVPETRTLD